MREETKHEIAKTIIGSMELPPANCLFWGMFEELVDIIDDEIDHAVAEAVRGHQGTEESSDPNESLPRIDLKGKQFFFGPKWKPKGQ